jgi:3-hydroxyacyl-[acyl-carrier-protein] dehydratase
MNRLRQELRRHLAVAPGGSPDAFVATLTIPADLEILAGHFPGNPVLPGVCLLQLVLVAAEMHFSRGPLRLLQVGSAKFLAPVLPEQAVTIDGQCTPAENGRLAIRATVTAAGRRAAVISLTGTWP